MAVKHWPWAPAPYSRAASGVNLPLGMENLPWNAVRARSPHAAIDPTQRLFGTMWLPRTARTAFPNDPLGGLEAVSAAERRLRELAHVALAKHAQGVLLSREEREALFAVPMPAVVREQVREGVGAQVRSDRVPPLSRSSVPQSAVVAASSSRFGARSSARAQRAQAVVDLVRGSFVLAGLRGLGRVR